jgi:hypothetical protein
VQLQAQSVQNPRHQTRIERQHCELTWPAFVLQDTEVDHSNVITIGGQDIAIGDATGSKKALPPGTTRNVFRGYEEVAVPAVDPGKLLPDEKLVEIAALDGWAQSAFKGYKTLNRIQSRIFEVRPADAAL